MAVGGIVEGRPNLLKPKSDHHTSLAGIWKLRQTKADRQQIISTAKENERIVRLHLEEKRQQHRLVRDAEVHRAVEAAVRKRWPTGIPDAKPKIKP